jgi:O-acetyl-ADP-ribose deacetylase (regulator of RNase III)
VSKSGLIHREMIDLILGSEIVLVDITTGNPNVMYELGIRHAAKRWGTIILRQASAEAIPFNISGLRSVEYQLDTPTQTEHSRLLLETNLRNCLVERNIDSLVHTLFPGLNVTRRAKPCSERRTFVWSCPKAPHKRLCIVTGDIINVDTVDLWVNPENTKMQMGRYYDRSISSYIRYYGATRDCRGAVVSDTIFRALNRQMGAGFVVEPGTVIVTHPDNLRRSNNVKAVLHVAAQHGEPGRGYTTIRSYENCVTNALDAAEEINGGLLYRLGLKQPSKSIIFPLFGTRNPDDDPQAVALNLVRTAKNYLETWPTSKIERVYFLAWTDADEELCLIAFQRLGLTFEKVEPDDGSARPELPAAAESPHPATAR